MSATTSSATRSANRASRFVEGDVMISHEWIEYHVKKCDAVIPLVAIANPAQYVKDPLRVFELGFRVQPRRRPPVREIQEAHHLSVHLRGLWHVPDRELSEHATNMVYGPIDKQRWIYACSKQLLDRVIYAYGVRDNIDYTLFRPFNWIGPKLDNVFEQKEGSSRLFTQFISNVIYRNRSSWSTAASRAVPSLSSTTASTPFCASSRTRTAGPRARSSTWATRRTT